MIGRKVDYWRLWWEHQVNDDYWQQFRHRPEKVDVPIFQQGGWFDPYSGSHLRVVRGDRRPRAEPRADGAVVARGGGRDVPRRHRPLARADRDPRARARLLRPLPQGRRQRLGRAAGRRSSTCSARTSGAGESEWPLARTEATPFYLRSGGGSRVDEPSADEPGDRYDYDPADPVPTIGGVNSVLTMTQGAQTPIRPGPLDQRPLEGRDDVLVYTSEPLERDLEVIGPVEMVLYAASSRARHRLLRAPLRRLPGRPLDLPHRGRHPRALPGRASRASRSSCSSRARSPSTGSAAIRWRTSSGAGHRIRLDVTSSSFPRFSRNLNTGEDVGTGTRMEVARQTVLHTDRYPSHVVLPVIPRERRAAASRPTRPSGQLEAARAAGVEPVPLAGTPSPRAPDARRRGGRGRARPPDGRAAVRAAWRRCERRYAARARAVDRAAPSTPETEILVTNGAMHALGICFRSLLARRGRGRRPGPVLLLRGPDPRGRRRARLRARADADDGWRWDAEAIERAIGPRTRGAPALQSRQPDRLRPHAGGGRGRRRGRGRARAPRRHGRGLRGRALGRRRLTSAFGLADDVVADPQPRQEPVDAAAPAWNRFRTRRPLAAVRPTRSSGTASASISRRRTAAVAVLEGPARLARRRARRARRGPRRRARRRRRDARARGRRPGRGAVPLRSRRLGRAPSPPGSLAPGLPVVDGIHFQAPGYARLPFAGAARAADALAGALARWAAAAVAVSSRAAGGDTRRGGRSR